MAATVTVVEVPLGGVSDVFVSYRAEPGEVNDVTVHPVVVASANDEIRITDAGASIAAGAGCKAVTIHDVVCSADDIDWVELELGDRDDIARADPSCPNIPGTFCSSGVALRGGEGHDMLTGSDDDDDLSGGSGDDQLAGRAGFDSLDGGPGADVLLGGSDSDDVHYRSRTAPVHADLEGDSDDGEAGERDAIGRDVEDLVGGTGADVLEGDDRTNILVGGLGSDRLSGGDGLDFISGDVAACGPRAYPAEDFWRPGDDTNAGGDDVIDAGGDEDWVDGCAGHDYIRLGPGPDEAHGGAGNDRILGETGGDGLGAGNGGIGLGAGNDVFVGGPGDDFAWGGFGDDRLLGGRGSDLLVGSYDDDRLTGGPGPDSLLGGAGGDWMYACDGTRDTAKGGAGRDRARAERLDRVLSATRVRC